MSRVLATVGSLVLLASLGGVASARKHKKHRPSGDDMAELPQVMALRRQPGVQHGVTVYLNKDGGTLNGGWDDSAAGTSSIAMSADNGVARVPAWAGSSKAWKQVVACAQDRFAPFDVDIVTDRPSAGEYVMIMVGGMPSMFGYPSSVSGVAPYTGEVVRGAVGYVFSANIDEDVDTTCVSVIHEAGHTLGLDHEYLCEDPMSYLWGCGEKRFRDLDAPCGEDEERTCGDGSGSQNSYRVLARNVGLRNGKDDDVLVPNEPPVVEDDADDDVPYDDGSGWGTSDDDGGGGGWGDDEWQEPVEEPTYDAVGPAVSIDGDAESVAGNQWIEITVRAQDDDGVADVELGWASDDAQYVISCATPPDDMPVACTRDGDVFRFQLYVGAGWRAMAARATDAAGNQTISDARVLYLED